jgi:hypothetical protein
LNRAGKKPATLTDDVAVEKAPIQTLNSDLERLDKKFQKGGKKKKKKKRNKNRNQNQNANQNQARKKE